MKAYDIVGYTFDGDIYHTNCLPDTWKTTHVCGEVDENNICLHNCHGSGPTVVFANQLEGGEVCGHCEDLFVD